MTTLDRLLAVSGRTRFVPQAVVWYVKRKCMNSWQDAEKAVLQGCRRVDPGGVNPRGHVGEHEADGLFQLPASESFGL